MFKVQRFTAEDEEEESRCRVDDSSNILHQVLERAKARASAKRARLDPSSDGVQGQAASSASPLERKPGAKFALNSGAGGRDGTSVSRGAQSSTTTDSSKDRTGGASQEEGGGTSDDNGDASEGEESSSGESSSEDGERGDSGEEESNAEIMPSAEPARAKPQGSSAPKGDGQDPEPGEQGLRPMEEVAEEWGLDSRLAETLREEGVKHFFPIQVPVYHHMLDLCCSAACGTWHGPRASPHTGMLTKNAMTFTSELGPSRLVPAYESSLHLNWSEVFLHASVPLS